MIQNSIILSLWVLIAQAKEALVSDREREYYQGFK